jgi:hypothetical protein
MPDITLTNAVCQGVDMLLWPVLYLFFGLRQRWGWTSVGLAWRSHNDQQTGYQNVCHNAPADDKTKPISHDAASQL